MEKKECSKCGEEKLLIQFSKDKKGKMGISSRCKECTKKYHSSYYLENKDYVKKKTLEYQRKHPDKQWSKQHPEEKRNADRKYRLANIEKLAKIHLEWKKNNPEKVRELILRYNTKRILKKQIGSTPPKELVEAKVLINKTKQLCRTLLNS